MYIKAIHIELQDSVQRLSGVEDRCIECQPQEE